MEFLLDLVRYGVLGFFGLIGALFVLALLFGKRMETKWDLEADFRDERGREIGEFDIELKRVVGEDADFTLRAEFTLRHAALAIGQPVEVCLEDAPVMRGTVETEGRIRLGNDHLCGDLKDPAVGEICSVRVGGAELLTAPLQRD